MLTPEMMYWVLIRPWENVDFENFFLFFNFLFCIYLTTAVVSGQIQKRLDLIGTALYLVTSSLRFAVDVDLIDPRIYVIYNLAWLPVYCVAAASELRIIDINKRFDILYILFLCLGLGHFLGFFPILAAAYQIEINSISVSLMGASDFPGRTALITGGATVPFIGLLEQVATLGFLSFLKERGFERVHIQCGTYCDVIQEKLDGLEDIGIIVDAFSFNEDLKGMMLECRGEKGERPAGLVIGHAGTGTISDACDVEAPLIIVPNPTLMDNHQEDIAAEISKDDNVNVVVGRLGELQGAVAEALGMIKEHDLDNLCPYQMPPFPVPENERITFLDQMVANSYDEV